MRYVGILFTGCVAAFYFGAPPWALLFFGWFCADVDRLEKKISGE